MFIPQLEFTAFFSLKVTGTAIITGRDRATSTRIPSTAFVHHLLYFHELASGIAFVFLMIINIILMKQRASPIKNRMGFVIQCKHNMGY